MKNLHLKFHSETGTSHLREIEVDYETDKSGRKVGINIYPDEVKEMNIPSDEYIEWLEDLAEKHLNQQKINEDANKVMAKFESIKIAFDNLKSEVGSV